MSEIVIVGAGFSGSVVAERLACAGYKVRVIEQRPHIGGNAFDGPDAAGVLVHWYGPHIFHTNSERVFSYLSGFTAWRDYEHNVLASIDNCLLPIPINLDTVNQFFGVDLDEAGVADFLDEIREPRDPVVTSEDVVLNAVGRRLYEAFFRGYTRKQWGLDPSELAASVAARIPVRTNRDGRYFTDIYQAMPARGYAEMFARILDHPNIKVECGIDYFGKREKLKAQHTVYTGAIDAYFDHTFGKLPYRSLRFEHEHLSQTDSYQAVTTVNYPNDFDFTRITEFKKMTGQKIAGTSIMREYPQANGDPYYPIPRPENQDLFARYRELSRKRRDVTFVGRLAEYRYYNMDQAVGSALKTAEKLIEQLA